MKIELKYISKEKKEKKKAIKHWTVGNGSAISPEG